MVEEGISEGDGEEVVIRKEITKLLSTEGKESGEERNIKKTKFSRQMLQNWKKKKTTRFSDYIHLSRWRRRKAES